SGYRASWTGCGGACLVPLAHQGASMTRRHFLETELSVISTLIDVARGRYQRGNRRDGDLSNADARERIATVRRFIGTADFSPARTAFFARRCGDLERAVAALTKSQPD